MEHLVVLMVIFFACFVLTQLLEKRPPFPAGTLGCPYCGDLEFDRQFIGARRCSKCGAWSDQGT